LQKKSSIFVATLLVFAGLITPASKAIAANVYNPLSGKTPVISGTGTVGSVLTASSCCYVKGNVVTYQWYRDGIAISSAKSPSYSVSPADLSRTITVLATVTYAGASQSPPMSAPITISAGVLSLTPPPEVTGERSIGSVLEAHPGVWDSGVSLSYQWFRDDVAIPSAVFSKYTISPMDLKSSIVVEVTGTLRGYTTVSARSIANIIPADILLQPTPKIQGDSTCGSTLSVNPGTWDPGVTFNYQWFRNGSALESSISPIYRTSALDRDSEITVKVTGSLSGYLSASQESLPFKNITCEAMTLKSKPSLVGEPKVGLDLRVNPGSWDSGVTLTYQWFRDSSPIESANDQIYTLSPADLGRWISVEISATSIGYETVNKQSDSLLVELGSLQNQPSPTISGLPNYGNVLLANSGTWDDGVNFSYQWFRNGSPIQSATLPTYRISSIDLASIITVQVKGFLVGYKSESKESKPKIVASTISVTPQVSNGGYYACAVTSTGAIRCWGENSARQAAVPSGLDAAIQVSAGIRSTCALIITGTVRCWGDNSAGQTNVPSDLNRVSQISTGYQHVCALSENSKVYCWGSNGFGQTSVPSDLPAILQVSAGTQHTCVLTVLETVRCWGSNTYGAVTVPSELSQVIQVSAGGLNTCALNQSGRVVCWGINDFGQTNIPGDLGEARQIVTGKYGTICAITILKTVRCWGWNYYGQGNVPPSVEQVENISVGLSTISVETDGSINCWPSTDKACRVPMDINPLLSKLPSSPVPSIAGTPVVNSVLKAELGNWDDELQISYQWFRDGISIPGATHPIYKVSNSDLKKSITVQVTSSFLGYASVTSQSEPLVLTVQQFSPLSPAEIVGGNRVQLKLKAFAGVRESEVDFAYQWFRDGQEIQGATDHSYTLGTSDLNKRISFQVTFSKPGYEPLTQISSTSELILQGFSKLVAPVVKGKPKVGYVLSSAVTSMGSGVTYSYQWFRDGVAIEGANGRNYFLDAEDANTSVTFQVCGSKPSYETACLDSNASAIALGELRRKPRVGLRWTSVKPGAVIESRSGTWEADVNLTYSWLRDGVEIANETGASYQVTAADRGHSIAFKVVAQKYGYNEVVRTSLAKLIP
jgi:hypothetical protein